MRAEQVKKAMQTLSLTFGWVMRVEARPSAGWGVWDALYLFCNKVGVACSWYRSP